MQSNSSVLPAGQAPTVSLARKDDTDVYAVPEAARRAGVSRAYYYRAARAGTVPAKFLGRRVVVPKRLFHEWLEEAPGVPHGQAQPVRGDAA